MAGQRGFTLIEMAIVLAIIGLLLGGGLIALGPMIDKTHQNQTVASLDQIETALVLFAIRNNRLPCPADGSLGAAAATYGQELVGTMSAGIAATCTVGVAKAVIPWITLGLDENNSVDGWGRRISYIPAHAGLSGVDSLVENNSTGSLVCQAGASCALCLSRSTGPSGGSTRYTKCDYNATPISPSYPWGSYIPIYAVTANTELTLPQPPAGPCGTAGGPGDDTTVTAVSGNVGCAGGRAAYVLISHGASGWFGWGKSTGATAAQIPAPSNAYNNKLSNSTGTAPNNTGRGFYQGTPIGPSSNINYFDDIVRWRTPSMIIQLCGAGACGNP